MTYPVIPDTPEVPVRKEAKADFSRKASDFIAFLPTLGSAINAAAVWFQWAIDTVFGYKNDAQQSAQDAQIQAEAASEQADLATQQVTLAGEQVDLAGQQVAAAAYQVSLAAEQVDLAAGQVTAAQDAASIARSAANFKGEWSSLSGSISMPASVRHAGIYWTLLEDIANVAASQPGVSDDWAALDTSSISWQPISASATLVAGRSYAVNFSGGALTLMLPPDPVKDDLIQAYRSAGSAVGSTFAGNGETIMGQAQNMNIDTEITSLSLVFNGSDWRIIK